MAKSERQKLKILYIMQYLMRHSDESHPVSVAQIIAELEKHGISAERKSIYSDIEALRDFGVDILPCRGRVNGYYVASREFELPELKLLVDSVQSSKFITQKKTLSLIKKIESPTSVFDAQFLSRQVFVRGRVKSMNESVYYNVDEISGAIARDQMIRFQYYEYTVGKERRARRDGAWYEVSPFALMWDDENYYMLAWDGEAEKLKHYRVDKMAGIDTVGRFREGKEAFERIDMSAYSKKVFGMFTGEQETVRIRFANRLAGAVIDRFGRDVMLIRDGEERFIVSVEVEVSPQFFAWVFGFGAEAEILSPERVRAEMYERAAAVGGRYEK